MLAASLGWPEVAVAAISACQVVALAALAIVMERSRRESGKRHTEVVRAIANGDHDSAAGRDAL